MISSSSVELLKKLEQENSEDAKGVIRSLNSKKDMQDNGKEKGQN
jgi:hypothetical protein